MAVAPETRLRTRVAKDWSQWLTPCFRIRAASTASAAATGTALAAETYVHIEWPWLSFVAAQVILSVAFLLGIMVQTAVWGIEVIKGSGSSMITLLAVPASDRRHIEALTETAGGVASRQVESLSCRFKRGDRKWSLALAPSSIGGRPTTVDPH